MFEVVNHHNRYFSLMDIFSHIPFGALKLFSLQVEQIILNLEGYTKVLDKLAQEYPLFCWSLDIGAHHSGNQTSQYPSFMRCHLQILLFVGVLSIKFIVVVPYNVPALTNMQLNNFLKIDLHQLIFESFGVLF